jgi:hypothetical protein
MVGATGATAVIVSPVTTGADVSTTVGFEYAGAVSSNVIVLFDSVGTTGTDAPITKLFNDGAEVNTADGLEYEGAVALKLIELAVNVGAKGATADMLRSSIPTALGISCIVSDIMRNRYLHDAPRITANSALSGKKGIPDVPLCTTVGYANAKICPFCVLVGSGFINISLPL